MCCGGGPDYSGMNQAAVQTAELSQQALDWAKQIYGEQAPQRLAAEQRAKEVSDAELGLMKQASTQATDLENYQKSTFRPVEQTLVQRAMEYDTPERRAAAAAAAGATVDESVAKTQQANERAYARMGTAPNAIKLAALREDAAGGIGKAKASAMADAVRQVEAQGQARLSDVANLGRNIASSQATQQQVASSTGTAGVNASNAALAATMSGNAGVQQGFGTAINGMTAAGNLWGQMAQIQQKDDSGFLGGLGQLGTGLGAMGLKFSSKKLKKDTKTPASTKASLKAVEKTPVKANWKYDPAKGGPNDGGMPHTGPMAEDVHKNMGPAAAPGGKMIDPISMNGTMMAAIQELSKQVKSLQRKVA